MIGILVPKLVCNSNFYKKSLIKKCYIMSSKLDKRSRRNEKWPISSLLEKLRKLMPGVYSVEEITTKADA